MTEKGFATILSLCLILVIALIVKGIQEAEMNHAYETSDFQAESDLQNAADSGIYAAAELVRSELAHENPDILPLNKNPYSAGTRRNYQVLVRENKKINVEVWGERVIIGHLQQEYPSYSKVAVENKSDEKAYVLFSKAEMQSKRMNGKIYRRSFAYILLKDEDSEDEDGNKITKEVSDTTIHFMELPSSSD